MTLYRHWIQALCLLTLTALLPVRESVELLFCLFMAGMITWKISGIPCVQGTLPASMPAVPSDRFVKRFSLSGTEACSRQFPELLALSDEYDQPETDSLTPCWKYEPDTFSGTLVPAEAGYDVYVHGIRVGAVPADLCPSVDTWQRERRILSARVSFYGGPYRKLHDAALMERESPWQLQMQLTVRRRTI